MLVPSPLKRIILCGAPAELAAIKTVVVRYKEKSYDFPLDSVLRWPIFLQRNQTKTILQLQMDRAWFRRREKTTYQVLSFPENQAY